MPTTISVQQVSKTFGIGEQPQRSWVSRLFESRQDKNLQQHLNAMRPPEEPARLQALDNITLHVAAGETLAVLGPSGCGKTTLLRIVAGLIQPTQGSVYYDGESIKGIPPDERGVGMVFQNYALYPHLSGVGNVGMFLNLRKREQEIPERIREISEFMRVDLEPLLGRLPPTMSGGEKQRIAIARCLARDPRVFLFDEPFANLDAKFRNDTRVELKRLLQRYQVTSIYVTHDQKEAIALADRIAILREGRLIQVGSLDQLYNAPINTFVAGFFGSPTMNLFPGHASGGQWRSEAFTWGPIRNDLSDGTPLILGVRPEHFQLDEEGDLTAVISHIEPHYPAQTQVAYATVGPHRITAQLALSLSLERGDTIRLSPISDQVHLFDGITRGRIG